MAVIAMASARGVLMPCERAGVMAMVRQTPLSFAWMAIFAVNLSGDQRMEVDAPWQDALTPGGVGGLLLSHGMGGMAAAWV